MVCCLIKHRSNFTFLIFPVHSVCQAGMAQWCSAGLDDWGGGIQIPVGAGNFSPHHHIQTGSGTHPASYPMGTKGSFPGGEVARVCS
jgi:hypothetical protein